MTGSSSNKSWVESANAPGCDFPLENLPYGMFEAAGNPHVGAAIGDRVLDLTRALGVSQMSELMEMPPPSRTDFRRRVRAFLETRTPGAEELLMPLADARMLLPCAVRDYTDFYASIDHATNIGKMFRPDNPLMPNYKWLPVAYHGRASSVVVSGTPIRRPSGQTVEASGGAPSGRPAFGPTRRLDYELELGAWLGPGSSIGEPIPAASAEDHIFGVCLLNDWSARDIQAWEYQPLGPFLAKNFATTVSPWIVTMEALEPYRCEPPRRTEGDPAPLPYLGTGARGAYSITLEVWLKTAHMTEPVRLSRSNFASMYWTVGQMVTHHASNGCPLRAGDLIGSGTVSGPEKENRGCLMELSWRGSEPLELPNGETRRFLEDGDEVILRGWAEARSAAGTGAPGAARIGLGECRGVVLPASE